MIIPKKRNPLNSTSSKTSVWLVIMLTFGYPIQAAIPILLHVSSTPINASFRAVYAIVALFLVLSALPKRKFITSGAAWLLFFWFLYSIRFIVDISVRDIKFSVKTTFFMYSMVFGSSVLPMVAVIFNSKYIDLKNFYKKIYGVVLASNLLILFLIFFQNGGLSLALFSSRIDIIGLNADEHVINSIVIGQYGSVLFLLTIYSFMFTKHKNVLTSALIILFGLFGLFNLIISASRGPFLSMFFLLLFMLYFKYTIAPNRVKRIGLLYKISMVFLLSIFVISSTGILSTGLDKFTLFSRLSDFNNNLESGVKESRNYQYESALNQFYSSPIVGDQYVTTYDASYPHNIYLEVLMSLGLLGAFVFLVIHYELAKRIRYIFKNKNREFFLVLIILIMILLAAMTSGGIALNPELWMILTLFLTIRPRGKRINTNVSNVKLTMIDEKAVELPTG